MKKFNELSFEDRRAVTKLFSNWLRNYTSNVIMDVMAKKDDIITNDFAMDLLTELYQREGEEYQDFCHSIGNLMDEYETFKEYDPHSHPVTHAESYRDILYDMFIR